MDKHFEFLDGPTPVGLFDGWKFARIVQDKWPTIKSALDGDEVNNG